MPFISVSDLPPLNRSPLGKHCVLGVNLVRLPALRRKQIITKLDKMCTQTEHNGTEYEICEHTIYRTCLQALPHHLPYEEC